MKKEQIFDEIFSQLGRGDLGGAMDSLESFLATHPHQVNADRLHALRSEFDLMSDYWKRGFKDPQLPALFQKLVQRMYVLSMNICKEHDIRHSSFFSSIFMRLHMTARDWSPSNIRDDLEMFVSETAMLELEPENKRQAREKELYENHQHQMSLLFDHILTSDLWTDAAASAIENILLSPTVDVNDQLLMLSAMTLTNFEYFDMAKFRTLVHVYEKSTDESVRQRALVGWALSTNAKETMTIYPEIKTLIDQVLEDEKHCLELVELQKQLIFCISAEQDNATIQREIMPDLMKGQGFYMTEKGIVEKDENSIEDIISPDKQEQMLEKMEEGYQRMVNMQRQGSDIYFSGFSHMKRYPFFYDLSNWFVPFFKQHPAVKGVLEKMGMEHFMDILVTKGPFCNSDKYSFVFAFDQVFNQIPANLRQLIERGEASLSEWGEQELHNPVFIRRIYLQDLYRFFRLFRDRSEFRNLFDESDVPYIFCNRPIFSGTQLESYFNDVVAFMLKRKRLVEACCILDNYSESQRDFQFYMMAGYLSLNFHKELETLHSVGTEELYLKALQFQPDNEKALSGYARSLFLIHDYQKALETYEKLLTINPKKSYILNKAVCLLKLNQSSAAVKDLYKMNYESPDDTAVTRVLAWALVREGKYEAADKIYSDLLNGDVLPDDLLNYGYCLWFSGRISEAADCFRRFLKESKEKASYILTNDAALLKEKGITDPEQQMMLYIL